MLDNYVRQIGILERKKSGKPAVQILTKILTKALQIISFADSIHCVFIDLFIATHSYDNNTHIIGVRWDKFVNYSDPVVAQFNLAIPHQIS